MVMMGPFGSLLLGLAGFAAAAVHLYAFTYPGGPPAGGAGGAPGLPAD